MIHCDSLSMLIKHLSFFRKTIQAVYISAFPLFHSHPARFKLLIGAMNGNTMHYQKDVHQKIL